MGLHHVLFLLKDAGFPKITSMSLTKIVLTEELGVLKLAYFH